MVVAYNIHIQSHYIRESDADIEAKKSVSATLVYL